PFGAALPWPAPDRPGRDGGRRPARTAGATVVIAGGEPVLYLERGARALHVLVDADDGRVGPALEALADHARAGRIRRIALERIDGEPAIGSRWEPLLAAVGFTAGMRRLTLTASP